jgi:capsid protein
MRFKLFKRAEEDAAFRRLLDATLNPKSRSTRNVFRHTWTPPTWPYIQPVEDATADVIRSANSLASMTRIFDERGCDWSEDASQIVKDRKLAMMLALQAAMELKEEFPELTTDIDTLAIRLFPLPTADKTSVSIQTGGSLTAAQSAPPETSDE